MQQNQQQVNLSKMLDRATDRVWTDDQLRALPLAALEYISCSNGIATVPPAKQATHFTNVDGTRKIPTSKDREAATRIKKTFGSKSNAHLCPETYLNTTGGAFFHAPRTVQFTPITGPVQERANAVIPIRYDETENYSNVQAVACFAAQLVQNKNATWVSNVNGNAYTKVWAAAEVGHENLSVIVDDICDILNTDAVWTSLSLITKNAITGVHALAFVRSALDRTIPAIYHLLNTRIVLDFLQAWEGEGTEWTRRENDKGEAVIPEKAYQRVQVEPDILRILISQGYPCCFWYRSGFIPLPSFPPNTGTLLDAKLRHERMIQVAGKSDAPTLILAGMKGYSGITDDFGKRMQFFISAALGCWRKGLPVDIQVKSVGDVPMLVSSLNKWAKDIKEMKEWSGNASVIGDFKIMVPSIDDSYNVPAVFHSALAYSPRKNSVIISHRTTGLPTSGTKGTVMDYEFASLGLYPEPWRNNDVVMFTPIFGNVCFSGRQHAQFVQLNANSTTVDSWPKKTFVYQFGNCNEWRGILSTIPNFRMIGYGAVNVGSPEKEEWDEKEKLLAPFELKEFASPDLWYKAVGNACLTATFTFMSPISRFSPISNLPFISKAGVQILLSIVASENGEIIGNMVRMPNKSKIKSTMKLALDVNYSDVASEAYKSPTVKKNPPISQKKNNSSNSSNSSLIEKETEEDEVRVFEENKRRRKEQLAVKSAEQRAFNKLSMAEREAIMKKKMGNKPQGEEEENVTNNFAPPNTEAPSFAQDEEGPDAPADISLFDL